jgi:hypothetical protein
MRPDVPVVRHLLGDLAERNRALGPRGQDAGGCGHVSRVGLSQPKREGAVAPSHQPTGHPPRSGRVGGWCGGRDLARPRDTREEDIVGYNGMIVKGHVRIEPHRQVAAHRAILELHNGDSIDSSPANGYEAGDTDPLVRRKVVLPTRCLESEDVWEALASWGSFYMPEVPSYVPRDMTFKLDERRGIAYDFADEWRRILRDAELWHALAPYIKRATLKYEGDDRGKWAYQLESDGRMWEWVPERGKGWRKVRPLRMEELVRPKPMVYGWTKVTTHNGDGTVEQYEAHLGTGERRSWSDPQAAALPKIIVR